MDAWKKCVRSAGKNMSIKFLVLRGGGILVFFWGGGKCQFYFYGSEDFSDTLAIPDSSTMSIYMCDSFWLSCLAFRLRKFEIHQNSGADWTFWGSKMRSHLTMESRLRSCDPGNPLEPPKSRNVKSDSKVVTFGTSHSP